MSIGSAIGGSRDGIGTTELVGVLLIVCVAATVQFRLAIRQSLWADELFSLAIATGHSLEHPANQADPALGDYVEPANAVPAVTLRRYLEHENPPAGLNRVLRAVSLSDTSPPLYYLLLNFWMRVAGATDLSLRVFSMAWALASFPVLCLVAHRLGGKHARRPAAAFLAAAPLTLWYATEGRMYSMLWFLAISQVALTIELHRLGSKTVLLVAWILIGAAGFLTHYFFAFAWAACAAWLFIEPALFTRRWLVAAAAVTGVLVLPWYVLVPGILGRWRVTGDWLNRPLTATEAVRAPFDLAWNFLSGPRWAGPEIGDWVAGLVVGLTALAALRLGRSNVFSGRRALVWLWLAAACVGPLVVDLLKGTRTAAVPRYALAGAPAALLLVAYGVSLLPSKLRLVAVFSLVLTWSQGVSSLFQSSDRAGEPFRRLGESISASIRDSDVVLVHSIPSGVLGMARYLNPNVQVATWVGQLGQRRIPDDIQKLTGGHAKVVLVKIHDVGAPAPEEAWLREHAVVVEEVQRKNARVLTFAPQRRELFAWAAEGDDTISPIGGALRPSISDRSRR